MLTAEELVGEEWAEWYRLSPTERWLESEKLWQAYLMLGGSLDPEPAERDRAYWLPLRRELERLRRSR